MSPITSPSRRQPGVGLQVKDKPPRGLNCPRAVLAVSGASLLRPGIQDLMRDALSGKFEIILAEALDRLSRDQEDIAGVYKRLSFAGVRSSHFRKGQSPICISGSRARYLLYRNSRVLPYRGRSSARS